MNVFISICALIGGLVLVFLGLVGIIFVLASVYDYFSGSRMEWKKSRTKIKRLQAQVERQHLHIRALEDLLEEKRNEKTNAYR